MILLKIFIFLLFSIFQLCSSTTVDYYVDLIKKQQARAEHFSLPTDSKQYKPKTNFRFEYGTFDYIVVGAGSAGAIVASRLSEDRTKQVLLVEAGGNDTDFTNIPGMAGVALDLEYNWNYYSVAQDSVCLGMKNKQCYYARGKGMGGSSGINGLFYTRGNKKDYDTWCDDGNSGWCYDDVLPFFKKSENAQIKDGDEGYHGTNGYLNLEYHKPDTESMSQFLEANQELNISLIDYNGKSQLGVGKCQFNTINGRRCSTATFLKSALNRKNLKISSNSFVTKILIDAKHKNAHGILFSKDKKYFIARARKEIIISAGTIGSAQLLMLSGIGPKDHLEKLGIPVVKNLQVGNNLQDHFGYTSLHFTSNSREEPKSLENNVRDYLNGSGAFTNGFNAKAVAFVAPNKDKEIYPDVELLLIGGNMASAMLGKYYNFDNESLHHGWLGNDPSQMFTIQVVQLKPKSVGFVKLKSADPFDYPIINPNALSHPEDIETIYKGIQYALSLLDTNAFKKIGTELKMTHLPACKDFAYLSKRYWYCHIRQLSFTFAHIVGTCRMGPNPLKGAVVDHQLRVHGIKNLRVADASIMPNITSGHTNAPSMMIGEKAAHMIRFE